MVRARCQAHTLLVRRTPRLGTAHGSVPACDGNVGLRTLARTWWELPRDAGSGVLSGVDPGLALSAASASAITRPRAGACYMGLRAAAAEVAGCCGLALLAGESNKPPARPIRCNGR
jgi:hypothetical protein